MSDKQMPPQALYFDSNILRKWGWPDPSARLLETLAKAAGINVASGLVDLVRRELTEGWIRDTVRARISLAEKAREYSRRVQGLSEVPEVPRLPPIEQMREHLANVTATFAALFRIVPTSKQPVEYYMNLAMSRGGAFVEGGRGFNDTVILVSIVEDMAAHGIASAILVSEDGGYQNEGMKQVTGTKLLRVIRTLDELDDILDRLISDKVHAYLQEQKERLLAAVKSHETELLAFLRQNLTLSSDELGIADRVRKVEFLELIGYEDAHSVPFILNQESREENRLSVDVRVRVRVETESILFERRRERFDASPLVLHPEDILVSTADKEIVVTVEGAAEVTADSICGLRFATVRTKTKDRGFADILQQLRS